MAVGSAGLPRKGRARDSTLRILRWKHFVPGYDQWFNEVFVPEWSSVHGIDVTVDNVGLGDIARMGAEEAAAGVGHDLVLFLDPPPLFEDQAIDHGEIVQEVENSHGPLADFARRASLNPRTGKYFCFCEAWAPTVLSYRRDLWDTIGMQPTDWDTVRKGGRAIRLFENKPVGMSLAAEHNGERSWRAVLYAFGGAVQNADGEPILRSAQTRAALEFGKAFFEEASSDAVLGWNPPANNQFMLSGDGSLTMDTLSIPRAAENKALDVDQHLALVPTPEGPAGRIGPDFGIYSYVIWKFARNIDGAKRFLVDSVAAARAGFLSSGFQNMPAFPGSIPDLDKLVANDPVNPQRYAILNEVSATTTNVGHPGHANAATNEVQSRGIVSSMFARVATGQESVEDSMSTADSGVRAIFDKWREAGKI